jgi:hypothetical protein
MDRIHRQRKSLHQLAICPDHPCSYPQGMLLCIPPDGSMLRVRLRAHPLPGKKESDPRWLVAGESNLSAEDYPPLPRSIRLPTSSVQMAIAVG